MKKLGLSLAVIAAGLGLAASPARSHDSRHRELRATLKGFSENPTLSTVSRGSFRAVISEDGTEIQYRLDYSDLEADVTQSHIHFGAVHVNGGISVWLCGTATNPGPLGTPVCQAPGGVGPEAMGTITAANVVGPAGQGIAAGEFAELVRAIRAGFTYANVHTMKYPGGEIRGQIRLDD